MQTRFDSTLPSIQALTSAPPAAVCYPLCACPAAIALLSFKAGLEPADILPSWQAGSNPCGAAPWDGLACHNGLVVALRLQDMGIRGRLLPGLASLLHLEEVRLRGNQLTGGLWLSASMRVPWPRLLLRTCACMQLMMCTPPALVHARLLLQAHCRRPGAPSLARGASPPSTSLPMP